MSKPTLPGVFITNAAGKDLDQFMGHMDTAMQEWTLSAARGECSWVCSDCCMTFPEGMPDHCEHGHKSCTDIIRRDKAAAALAEQRTGGSKE